MTPFMKRSVLVMLSVLVAFFLVIGVRAAFADGSGSGSGLGSAATLHDPTTAPSDAFSDLKLAKTAGWAVLAFAALLMASKVAAKLGSKVLILAKLGTGKIAVVIAGVGAIAAAGYDAALGSGSWTAALMAAVVAIAHYFDATPKPAST